MTVSYIAAGTQQAYFAFVDSLGFMTGSTTSAPSTGSLDGMLRLLGIQTATPGLPEGDDVNIEGDDDVLGTISFAPNTTPAFVANFGAFDLTTNAAMQSTAVQTLAAMEFGVLQPNDPGFNNGTLIIQGRSISQDDDDQGLEVWTGFIFPLVVAQPLGRETFEGRTAAANRIKFTAQKASHKPWGVTIVDGDLGTDAASIIEFKSPNPLIMDRITGNGSTDSFTLSKAVAATNNIFVADQTQILSHGSGITATASSQTLAFSSAPASGNKVVVVYGFVP